MPGFVPFVRQLLRDGSARLREAPRLHAGERDAALAALRDAFDDQMLDVAGPPPPFVPAAALRAAEWFAHACWLLLHRGESSAAIDPALAVFSPRGEDEHASADVVLRFLPGLHRRARAAGPRDALAARIEELLRRWPLSGVLADTDEPPLSPIEFGPYPGLLLLYAERYAARPRPAWLAEGPAREYIELALAERNLS